MKRMLGLGSGAFVFTFLLVLGVGVDAAPGTPARAEAAVQTVAAGAGTFALASVSAPTVSAVSRVLPAPSEAPDEPMVFSAVEDAQGGPWSPPSWFPEESRDDLWALDGMSGHAAPGDGPTVRAAAAFVYDVDAGVVLYEKHADDRRPAASLTKVLSGLTALSENPDLSREICIDPSQWPGWPGAHSYLNTGTCTTGWDLLGAALVASDNRAAFAFAPISGLPFQPFVSHMNEIAADLGMDQSSFVDPAGVDDNNLSTARDLSRAILAASLHPVLGPVASAPTWDISETRREHSRRLFSTNRLADQENLEFLAAKTGYTDTARYCFAAVVRTESGRRVALAVLGAPNVRTRWADVRRIVDWVEEG